MYFISVTRLRLRSWLYLPQFLSLNPKTIDVLINTSGFIIGKELMDKHLTFWTVTVWQADADMKTFRNSPSHRKAMQKLPYWCDEASYAHWLDASPEMPSLETVYSKMITIGKPTKVRNPSSNQDVTKIPPIRWTRTGQTFMPK